jgi:hypothetical protein
MLLEIIGPCLLIIGLLGNAINFYIFTNPSLRSLTTFRFLTYLSIIDFLYLLTGLTHLLIIIYFDYDLRLISNFMCSVHSFLTIYLSHLSSNTLAAISISRCFKLIRLKPVKNEMKKLTKATSVDNHDTFIRKNNNRKFKLTFGHADYTILLIMIIFFIFDSHYLLWMRLSDPDFNSNSTLNSTLKQQCHPSLNEQFYYNKFLASTWVWIDLFLYSYIPFVIMMVCTVLITYKLCKVNKNIGRSKSTTSINQNKQQSVSNQNQLFKKRAKKTNQIYQLLILINVCFFVLVTPLVLSNSLGILMIENKIILELVYILSYLNHCINFVFYGLSCKMYRTILYGTFFNRKKKPINSQNNRTLVAKL